MPMPEAHSLPDVQSGSQPEFQAPQAVYTQLGYPGPIMQQPGPAPNGILSGWMAIPQGLTDCPPGLEYLSMVDELLIHQHVDLFEVAFRFETINKYTVKNSLGEKLYYAAEENVHACSRLICGPQRTFDIEILDNFQNEVIHLHRPSGCNAGCCPCSCCLNSVEVTAPRGTPVGSVEQNYCSDFSVKDAAGDVVLKIKHRSRVNFDVYTEDGENKVGNIKKEWAGFAQELFTDADNFSISFPMDLEVRIKAVLLGACFLIDFMYFEKNKNNRR